jgi:methylglyoxal synthase
MNIALIADESKQELMAQFCIAYCGVLAKHQLCATNTTGRMITENTGLKVRRFLSHDQGGIQQISARVTYNELDMVLFFTSAKHFASYQKDFSDICRACDDNNVPMATNIGTAEMLIQGLQRGDLDWRSILYPRNPNVIL